MLTKNHKSIKHCKWYITLYTPLTSKPMESPSESHMENNTILGGWLNLGGLVESWGAG